MPLIRVYSLIVCRLGRGSFHEVQNFVQQHALTEYSRFVAFDCPQDSFQNVAYEERMKVLSNSLPLDSPFVVSFITFYGIITFWGGYILVASSKCAGKAHIQSNLRSILDASGEGVVIRKDKSLYEHGRSHDLYKFKVPTPHNYHFCIAYLSSGSQRSRGDSRN